MATDSVQQNYANHRKLVPMFHFVLGGLMLLTLIGSIVNVVLSVGDHERIYSASLLVALTMGVILLMAFARMFALKAQDRAIRAEENLRCFVLTGKLLDPRLTMRQIVALRFAPDAEFLELAKRAADEKLPSGEIKRAIKNWRPDTDRA